MGLGKEEKQGRESKAENKNGDKSMNETKQELCNNFLAICWLLQYNLFLWYTLSCSIERRHVSNLHMCN